MIITLSTASISGCSPESRYKTLTFFFTGVPEPGSELTDEDESAISRTDVADAKKQKRHNFYLEPKFYTHGPFAANQCEKCHTSNTDRQFRITDAKSVIDSTKKRKRFGPRLAYPLEKLCISCHSDKSDLVARSLNLAVHEPVATGMCVKCHDPHKSARQYMLLGKDTSDLCATACHSDGELQNTSLHMKEKNKDCLECHNPHVGMTAQLLRSDYDEWQQYDDTN